MLHVWFYEAVEEGEEGKEHCFENGHVLAETFNEARKKIKQYLKDAWDEKLVLRRLEHDESIQVE